MIMQTNWHHRCCCKISQWTVFRGTSCYRCLKNGRWNYKMGKNNDWVVIAAICKIKMYNAVSGNLHYTFFILQEVSSIANKRISSFLFTHSKITQIYKKKEYLTIPPQGLFPSSLFVKLYMQTKYFEQVKRRRIRIEWEKEKHCLDLELPVHAWWFPLSVYALKKTTPR